MMLINGKHTPGAMPTQTINIPRHALRLSPGRARRRRPGSVQVVVERVCAPLYTTIHNA